jgi:HSP20 family molecular chaperone IbpA
MPSDRDDGDRTSDGPSDRPSGLLEQLRAIIDALAEIEEEEGGHRRDSKHIERGSTRIDYDYEVSVGLGSDERAPQSGEQPESDRSRAEGGPNQPGEEEGVHIETRAVSQDELLVIADLPDLADEELDIELDADEPALAVWAGEERVGRVALERSNVTISDVTLNNQILEIRLTRANQSTESESE